MRDKINTPIKQELKELSKELKHVPIYKMDGWWNRLDDEKKLAIYNTFGK